LSRHDGTFGKLMKRDPGTAEIRKVKTIQPDEKVPEKYRREYDK